MKRALLLLVMVGALACAGGASAASEGAFRPEGITAADSPVEAATALVEQRPALVDGADADELVPTEQERGAGGTTIVRFEQELRGVPVLGGEVVVTVDARRRVLAADGEVLDGETPTAFGPSVSAEQAERLARAALGKGLGEALDVTQPALVIYDARIVGGPGPLEPMLVWDLEVSNGADLRRRVFVDATTGYIVQTMDLIRSAKVRHVCDAANANAALPCAPAGYTRADGGAPSLISDVNDAYDYAGITYDFYAALGRDSIDGAGMPIISTVRWCASGCPYANAFWDGTQMVYGLSYATADDVVAHELTHGVTDYTSELVYWYQSGAINEAMSDIMGEFVDLANPGSGPTADTVANRWLMGEDLPIGAIRDMENPPAFNDPDKMTSPFYATGAADNGGVHTNSGVANKTAFLLADGGTFNGRTVTGLGLEKSAWLWYQTELTLRFASDFGDLADALESSCTVLATLGTAGFVSADCTQVAQAALATELRTEPANVTVPAYCASGAPVDVFNDGFDSGPATNWTIGRTVGAANLWYGSSQASPDGADMHWPAALSTNVRGVASASRSDSTMAMTSGVVIPAGESYLRFSHWYEFEFNDEDGQSYDGGVVEYSAGGGAWTDIAALSAVNGYTGTINATLTSDNPLEGRSGYVRGSNGPVITRVSLATLAGQTVRFRFRLGTDSGTGTQGWYMDDARIYGCATPTASAATEPAATEPAATSPAAPSTSKALPPAGGTWSVNAVTNVVRTLLPYRSGTTYAVKATTGSLTRKGTCRRLGTVVSCSVRVPNGRWRVTITPKSGGRVGKAISRIVRT